MKATILAAVGAATISLAGCATVTAEPNLTPGPIATSEAPSSLDELIAQQRVVDELPARPGYDRDCGKGDACSFGPAWTDDFDGKYARTGCDQRNETLSIQLRNVVYKPGTRNCKVIAGVLDPDPYTGRTIQFSSDNPSAIQVDHVFAVHRSWDAGAADWTLAQRKTFANDVDDNLLAVDGRANQSKGDKGLEWLPTAAFACTYATKYLTVAAKYQLLVTTNDITTAKAVCASTISNPSRTDSDMTSTMTPTEATTAGPEENPAVHTLEVSAEQAAAIELVQQKAPDARFGRFVASPIPGQPDYQQVNRVDKHGLLLTDGWTFLVNSKTQAVTRTIADPHNLDFKEAQRRGVPC